MYIITRVIDNRSTKIMHSENYSQAVINDLKRIGHDVVELTQYILIDGTVRLNPNVEGIHYLIKPTKETQELRNEHNLELLTSVAKELLEGAVNVSCTIEVGGELGDVHYVLTYTKGTNRISRTILEKEIHMYSQKRIVNMLRGELDAKLKGKKNNN